MRDPVDRAVRAIARRNSYALVWAQFGLAHLIVLGGTRAAALYQPMTDGKLLAAGRDLAGARRRSTTWSRSSSRARMWRPVWAWERGARDEASTIEAWTALATLPLEYVPDACASTRSCSPICRSSRSRPGSSHLPWYSFFVLAAAGTVVLAYGLIVRYFTIEVVSRPVLERRRRLPASRLRDRRPGAAAALAAAGRRAGHQRDHGRRRRRAAATPATPGCRTSGSRG